MRIVITGASGHVSTRCRRGVKPQAVFGGKYFMMIYLALCVATVAVFIAQRGAQRKNL